MGEIRNLYLTSQRIFAKSAHIIQIIIGRSVCKQLDCLCDLSWEFRFQIRKSQGSIFQHVMVRRLKLTRTQLLAANGEAQRQSCRAQESEKMKTAFINSMCHEIRTPLNAINGFSGLLLTEEDPEIRHEFQSELQKSTTALTTLLENMLELSGLISSEEPLPRTETEVCLLCAERLEAQRQLSGNPAVEYVYEAGGG